MNTERLLSTVLLLACVYGSVWAVRCKPDLTFLFCALTAIAFWTLTEVWSQVELAEPDQG